MLFHMYALRQNGLLIKKALELNVLATLLIIRTGPGMTCVFQFMIYLWNLQLLVRISFLQ